MITLMKKNQRTGAVSLYGLSTDTKPIDVYRTEKGSVEIMNGSQFFCIDTSERYMFDEIHRAWHKVSTSSGGGGKDGKDGQSAYEAAQEGGYEGTLEEFYSDLAQIEGLEDFLAQI